jgi:hypothetical protein
MRYSVLLLVLIPFELLAQPAQRQVQKNQTRSDAVSVAIRQDALSTADQVIDQVSEVDDLRSRVALAEKVVRVLVKSRPERLRKMLNTLFEDAIALGTDSPKTKSAPLDLDAIVGRIIQTAALIDVELARSYINVVSNLKAKDGAAKKDSNASILYLRIASELIRSNTSLAIEVAAKSLANGVSPDTLLFLASLREVDIRSANQFFIAALRSCGIRGAKDINELLLLYSYVFSPLRVPTVVSQKIGVLNIPGYSDVVQDHPVDADLARQYLEVLVNNLMNPLRYNAGNIEALAQGVEGDFYALNIIEPWVASYQPTKTSAIAEQRNIVTSYMRSSQRESAFSAADLWKNSPRDLNSTSGTTVEYLINKAETAADPKRKDQLYFRAALMAVRLKKYETASAIVEKISADYSDKAKQFIRFEIALQKIKTHQFLEADRLARMDNVLARRAYILILISDEVIQEDSSRALQYLDEVQHLVESLSDEKEKLAVLIGAASVYARLDTVRASEILQQIIQQANKMENFVGDSTISNVLEIGGFYYDYSIFSNDFNMFDLIKRLTVGSYYATLHDIRSLKNLTLRLSATMALCSAVILEENQTVRALHRN